MVKMKKQKKELKEASEQELGLKMINHTKQKVWIVIE